jgi:Carbamoyl-phosphate synthase L chain, ATP binding domain
MFCKRGSSLSAPRVLIVSASLWPLAGRISIALAKAGFCVAALSRTDSVIRKVKVIGAHYPYRPWAKKRSILDAVKAFGPDLLVCADDEAVSVLHRLYLFASKKADDKDSIGFARLIEASLGNPAGFAIARNKSRFVAVAKELGVRCPETVIIANQFALEVELENMTFPIVLKADGTCGGSGVRIANNPEAAQNAFHDLIKPSWQSAIVNSFDGPTPQPLLDWICRRRQVVTLQKYVSGRPANRAVLCMRGKVLAGLSVEVHETQHDTGPSTIASIINHDQMRKTTEILARRLELTGFHGFDFIIDSANQAWLLELNSRVTSMSHFSVGNFSPAVTLFSYLTEGAVAPVESPAMDKLIALFPQELQRCPNSEYLHSCYHDVPWDEPEFASACLSHNAEISFTGRIRRRIAALCGFRRASNATNSQNCGAQSKFSRTATTVPVRRIPTETLTVNRDVRGKTSN